VTSFRSATRADRPKGALADIPTPFLLPPEGSPAEFGLRGEYFDNPDLAGRPVLTRVDAAVDFRWGAEAPARAVPADGFSVRWTGRLLAPTSGVWRLGVTSDDGMRLFVDGTLLVDHWGDHGPDSRSAAIEFTKGRTYDLRIEYYDRQGAAEARLGWVSIDSLQADAVAAAGACDVAVVFAGLSRADEGEGLDRVAFALPEEQERLIAAVAAANSNTVVVLINGSPVGMNAWLAQTPAVLEAWYPGQEGGHAIANALFGEVNPSGKLPVTFPRRLEDNPSFGNFPGRDGRVHYAEDIFVGYRHYDARDVEPLFPFGHGLSYTTFRYENLQVRGDRPEDGEPVQVTVDVLNSGPRYGQEVVQVYVADRACSVPRPPQELKGFAKVGLRAGERKTVTVPLGADAFSFYDERKHAWTLEPGQFDIRVGSSSRDIRLTRSVTLR
jgi:beta-glucosidase